MRIRKLSKNSIILFVIIASLLALLSGCVLDTPDSPTATTEIKNETLSPTVIATEAQTEKPTVQATKAPVVTRSATRKPQTAEPTYKIIYTPSYITTEIVAPTPTIEVTPTPAPPVGTKAPETKPTVTSYKGVAMIGAYNISYLSPYGFSNKKTGNSILGTFNNQMWFGHDRCLYLEHYTGKQKEEGCRYFTIDLKGEEIFDKNNYLRLQEQGVFPLMYNNMNYSDVLDPEGFPTDLTKVYFDNWALDKYDIGRQTTGPTAAWTESYVLTDLEEAIKKIMKRCPNLEKKEIYIGGVLPWDRDIPRACNDPNYPDSYWAGGTMDYLFTAMKEKDPPHFKECNETIKAFAKKNGYTFIDFYETDLVDKDGYRKPQYTHYMDVGEILSRSGFKIYGDHIMDKMGLPRAK